MEQTVKLIVDGKTYEMPIIRGSEGENAIGRLPGWISQWKESIEDPNLKLHRPRQIYTGLNQRDYVPIEERT